MKTQVIKLLIFIALLGGFYAFGGFDRPIIEQEDYRRSSRMTRAWIATMTIFLAGAVLTVWGNSIAESVDWNIPDGLYPIIGAMLLIGGFLWMLMVRGSVGG